MNTVYIKHIFRWYFKWICKSGAGKCAHIVILKPFHDSFFFLLCIFFVKKLLYIFAYQYSKFTHVSLKRLQDEILPCKFSPIPTKLIVLLRTPFANLNFYEIIATASEILFTLTCHINFFRVVRASALRESA